MLSRTRPRPPTVAATALEKRRGSDGGVGRALQFGSERSAGQCYAAAASGTHLISINAGRAPLRSALNWLSCWRAVAMKIRVIAALVATIFGQPGTAVTADIFVGGCGGPASRLSGFGGKSFPATNARSPWYRQNARLQSCILVVKAAKSILRSPSAEWCASSGSILSSAGQHRLLVSLYVDLVIRSARHHPT